MASQRNISFWSTGYILFMDCCSKHKVDYSNDGWVLDSGENGEEESKIVSESDGNTASLTVEYD